MGKSRDLANSINPNSLDGDALLDLSVAGGKLENESIDTDQLALGAVTQDRIDSSVSFPLADGAVTTDKIDDGAVTQAKLDPAVSFPIPDGYIETQMIGDEQVTLAKLAPDAIPAGGFYTAPFPDALQRTTDDRLADRVSVLDFIPQSDHDAIKAGTSTIDHTGYINDAISQSQAVLIPPGDYNCDGTVLVGTQKDVLIGGRLIRSSSRTSNNEPVLWMPRRHSRVHGNGWIRTDNSAPQGIVLIGHLNYSTVLDKNIIIWNQFEGLRITGANVVGDGSKGIMMTACQAQFPDGGANYFNWIRNVFVQSVDDGLHMGAVVNGHIITNFQGYRIGRYLINCAGLETSGALYEGLGDLVINGCQIHSSGSLDAILNLEDTSYSIFSNIGGEPGSGKWLQADSGSTVNTVTGYANCPQSSTFPDSITVIRNSSINTGNLAAKAFRLYSPASDVPSTPNDDGTYGQIVVDNSYLYVCTGTDQWKRTPLSFW